MQIAKICTRILMCGFLVISLCSSISTQSKIDDKKIKEIIPRIEELIKRGMDVSHIPGLAIVIVNQNRVVFQQGYGVREIGLPEQIDTDTVFQIASLSKPISATVIASLVGKSKLAWESKIIDLDPTFRLPNPWVSAHVTVKDMLSHRSGLPDHAGDLLEDLGFDKNSILYRLRFINKMGSFRNDYAYTNFGFSVGAYASAKSAGMTWDALAKNQLFTPLGMANSSFSYQDFLKNKNRATIHHIVDEQPKPIYKRDPDAQAPAGGATASVKDLAKWMILCLDKGKFKGTQLISEEALLQTQMPVIVSDYNFAEDKANFYGLGWGVSYDSGNKFLKHSGGFVLGARTQAALVPDLKLGICVLTNASQNALPEALIQSFFDLLLKGEIQEDYITKFNQLWSTRAEPPPIKFAKPKLPVSPSLSLNKYTGKFENDFFGKTEIVLQDGKLVFSVGPKPEKFFLRHYNRDVFVMDTIGENAVGETQVIFTLDREEKVRSVIVDAFNPYGNGEFHPVQQ